MRVLAHQLSAATAYCAGESVMVRPSTGQKWIIGAAGRTRTCDSITARAAKAPYRWATAA